MPLFEKHARGPGRNETGDACYENLHCLDTELSGSWHTAGNSCRIRKPNAVRLALLFVVVAGNAGAFAMASLFAGFVPRREGRPRSV